MLHITLEHWQGESLLCLSHGVKPHLVFGTTFLLATVISVIIIVTMPESTSCASQ